MTVPPSDVSAPYAAMLNATQHITPVKWRWEMVRAMRVTVSAADRALVAATTGHEPLREVTVEYDDNPFADEAPADDAELARFQACLTDWDEASE